MKASELRIGNWIYRSFTKEDVKILGINAYETVSDGIVNSLSFKNGINLYCENISVLKPITLTEEWLLKFGIIDGDLFMTLFFIKKSIARDSYLIYFDDESLGIYIDYVHQLQNLFFVLTNTELQTT